ncbi:ribonuclease P protein component [Elizabethkingia anophelis]|uniref:ribonuclease P protein component n=1 Tax=Elizabethkingia TaxID=308865 RepID=UPI0007398EFA|nr:MULTISPECIES: ribonuclease P protein component [Elizabethkingia]KUF46273.1 ribonuclease P protein component [Elizabethkingia anophelis]MCT3645288.1 ribonuclease P protein component [Elizabethkingia anophelis]MCT3648646.1 ribonuclease P protein component [Elizabethkingia anophelis]MCT3652217.1 ribonuclease P protein component [Elizabethkingia anophelis]MCT3656371.1 ribonuclease P protein component [Elizabethkingia anophelis]
MKEFGFPSSEKLKAKKDIDRLFKEGKWITTGNLRIIWLACESETKVGVSISKRYFKKAVHRNRVKRLLREAYRLNKPLLHERFGEHFHIMLFWTSPQLPENLDQVKYFYEKLCRKN